MPKDSSLDSHALADLLDSKIETTMQVAELILELHQAGDVDDLDRWFVEKGIADQSDIERLRRAAEQTLCRAPEKTKETDADPVATRNIGSQPSRSHESSSQRRPSAFRRSNRLRTNAVQSIDYTGTPGSADRYDWIEQFAQGGLGAVWRAHDKNLDRSVAVKELLPDSLTSPGIISRFVDEATITGQLEHPGIVPIYEFGFKEDGCPYYAMKLLDGKTLATEIAEFSQLPSGSSERTVRFNGLLSSFVAICNAVAFAHERGVIHRDLKPGNIILGKFGEVSVVDWGIAKYYDRDEEDDGPATFCLKSGSHRPDSKRSTANTNRTRHGDIVGTPSFLSPEQARGSIDLDPRSDIYSLGVILYEILTGHAAFSAPDTTQIIENVRNGNFREPREVNRRVPKALEAICTKAMAHDRSNRYETSLELASDVRNYLAGERVRAYPENWFEKAVRWGKNNRSILFAGITALVAVTIVTSISYLSVKSAHQDEQVARKSAEEARDAALVARRHEVTAKQLAVANLKHAREAADEWLIESSGDIEFYPGLEETRREWLQNAVDHYQQCAKETKTTDPDLKAEAARALIRLGDAQRLLGRIDHAVESYAEASIAFETLLKRHRSTIPATDLSLQLANSHIGLGVSLPRAEAIDHLKAAETLLQDLVRADPGSGKVVFAFARCRIAQARSLRSTDPNSASTCLREAVRLLTVLSDDDPKRSHTALASSSLLDLAAIQHEQGQHHEALQSLEHGLEVYEELVSKFPHRPDFIDGRMTTHILMGNVYVSLGDSGRAVSCYEAAATDYGLQMEAMYRGGLHRENLAIAQVNLAQILNARGDLKRARESALFGHDELATLITIHGQDPDRLRAFAIALRTLAIVSPKEAAASLFANAMQIYDHLVETCGRQSIDVAERAVCRVQQASDEDVSQRVEVSLNSQAELASLTNRDENNQASLRILQASDHVALNLAEAFFEAGDEESSCTAFSALLRDLRERSDRSSRLTRVQLLTLCPCKELRDAAQGLVKARSLVSDYPNSSECRMILAVCQLQCGEYTDCESSIAAASQLTGGHASPALIAIRSWFASARGNTALAKQELAAVSSDQSRSSDFATRQLIKEAARVVAE